MTEEAPAVEEVEVSPSAANSNFWSMAEVIISNIASKTLPGKTAPFQRVNTRILETLPQRLKDNSFDTKFKYGSGDYYGIEGNEKLRDKAGKGFRKEKTKFKNKNFQGGKAGRIVYNVNSTKFAD